MPGHGRQCAYSECNRTTDRRSFGRTRTLTHGQLSSYSTWLKSSHDGVVCDYHHTTLRRQVEQSQRTQSVEVERMGALLAASTGANLPPSVDPASFTMDHALPINPIQQARSLSLPQPLSTPPLPPPPQIRRCASLPLLRANHRGCDAHQRKRIAFACVMSGVTWTTWNRLDASLNSHSLNKSTWYALTQQVWRGIEAVKIECDSVYTQQLLTANQPIVVVADGAWSHPGYSAGQHDWVLMNAADKKAIFSIPLHRSRVSKGKVVHQGNYDDGSSKGMEGYALDIAIKQLQSSGLAALITGWVGDQDSSVLKQLRECPAAQRWEVHLDPGHAKKNLQKALDTLFGEKQRFAGLAVRIPVFIMRLIKRIEREHAHNNNDMRNQFLQWLDCVVPHYTKTCGLSCPHHQRNEEFDLACKDPIAANLSSESMSKTYLNSAIHGTEITAVQSIIDRMKQTARYFIHGHNTCNVERYHRERLKLTPKLLEFWKTWAPRCALNQLLHNYGYAETHRLVLTKLDEHPSWSPVGVEPGNQYVCSMDRERQYHSARKSMPAYNRREDQLAREYGKRRAAYDKASQDRGHDYQHTPPLYRTEEDGEEVRQQRRTRRSKEQIEKENEMQEVEKGRVRRLFDEGDTTFTTLGVINVNVLQKKRGRKKNEEKKKEKGEETLRGEEEEDDDGRDREKKWRVAGKENVEVHPSSVSLSTKRERDEELSLTSTQSSAATTVTTAWLCSSRPSPSVTRATALR
jgi:hypothetical protein